MVRRLWIIWCILLITCALISGAVSATPEDQSNGNATQVEEKDSESEHSGQSKEGTETQQSGQSERQDEGTESPQPGDSGPSDETPSPWVTILEVDDPKGDDYGPGTYLYPTHDQFAPYQGLLDIEKFTVAATDTQVRFQVQFGQVTNPWNGPFGFSHQLMQIYIDHRPGGGTAPLIPGAKVVFSPKASWDTLFKVTGWGVYFYESSDRPDPQQESYQDAKVTVLADGKTIQIELPIGPWTHFEDLWDGSYYLLVGAQDGFGPDHYRQVKEEVSEWYFGGGDPSGYSSNVIDIITPPGKSQQKILGSYDPNTRILAVVEPVHRPNPVRKGIIYLISLGICLLIWFLWHRRDDFTRNT